MLYLFIGTISLLVLFTLYCFKHIQVIDKTNPECQQILLDIKRYMIK
jgi:hypothetical protein